MDTLEMNAHSDVKQPPTPPHGPLMEGGNTFVRLLLRSPLHRWLSGSLLILTYIGRRSGKKHSIPMSYERQGDVVTVFAYRSRGWWKQVQANPSVSVEIQRRRFDGVVTIIADDEEAISAGLLSLLRAHSSLARGYDVPLDATGSPDPDTVRRIARYVVMARIHITAEARGQV
jgi:F420H(2)-dependent quinone reductase